MTRIFHAPVNNESGQIYQILKERPESEEALFICSTPNYFQTLKPGYWVAAAQNSLALFKTILENPLLATWVNQSPENDPHGLLMIATFSHQHLQVAITVGYNLFSKEELESINQLMSVSKLRVT